MRRIRAKRWVILLLWGGLSFVGCKDPVEGCRDVDATNYDVSADESCEDCCTYPTATLAVSHLFDTLVLSYSDVYPLATGDGKFTKLSFYLSNFQFVMGGERLQLLDDAIQLATSNGTQTFVDDFVLISRDIQTLRYELGRFSEFGTMDSLCFSLGLSETANLVLPDAAPEDHPLARQDDTMYTESVGYIFHKLGVIPDTTTISDTLRYELAGVSQGVEICLPYNQLVSRGFDLEIPLNIDYATWLSGIDFVASTEVTVLDSIVTNATKAFSIDQE